MQLASIARIMKAFEKMMNSSSSVIRSFPAIERYSLTPERIDNPMLAAISASLFLASDSEDHVAEGINDWTSLWDERQLGYFRDGEPRIALLSA